MLSLGSCSDLHTPRDETNGAHGSEETEKYEEVIFETGYMECMFNVKC